MNVAFEIGASKTSPGGGGRAKQLNNEMCFSVNAAVVLEAIHSRSFLPAEVDWLPVRATMAKLRPGFFIFFFVFFFVVEKPAKLRQIWRQISNWPAEIQATDK